MAVRRKRVSGSPSAGGKGLAGAGVTVKGARATSTQLQTITVCLQTATELGCSRRVLQALVMCITQESSGTPLDHGDTAGPDSCGPFQQRDPWGPRATRLDPAGSTRLFLTVNRGPGVQGWRVVHGSLQNAPTPLSHAINKVQHSQYPDAYAQWEAEAGRTVDAFLHGSDLTLGAAAGAPARYEFQVGGDSSWWDGMGSLAEEVGWRRWASGNTLYFVSDDELRNQAPRVVIDGDEPWITSPIATEIEPRLEAGQATLSVVSGEHPVEVGTVIQVRKGPAVGRWLVASISGDRWDGPEAAVTLTRPQPRLPEPAAERAGGVDVSKPLPDGGRDLVAACRWISDAGGIYELGGGHRGAPIGSLTPGQPLDCSSSTSLALWKAGMFTEATAQVSGWFASSWGKPGRGKDHTVWANGEHVWIELPGVGRFDTSPYGDGGRGPRVRTKPRSTSGFTPRHWT